VTNNISCVHEWLLVSQDFELEVLRIIHLFIANKCRKTFTVTGVINRPRLITIVNVNNVYAGVISSFYIALYHKCICTVS